MTAPDDDPRRAGSRGLMLFKKAIMVVAGVAAIGIALAVLLIAACFGAIYLSG